jgi:D-alanine-D-alanine ligase
MRIAVIYNQRPGGTEEVIQIFGQQVSEHYKLETVEKVAWALRKAGHHVKIIDGNIHVIEKLKEFFTEEISNAKTNMVFNMSFGIQGRCRYAHIPSILEMLGIPYTGSDPEAHIIASDKALTKTLMQRYHIPTPDFYTINKLDEITIDFPFPLIVKPLMQAMSVGLELVRNPKEFHAAVANILGNINEPALVEKFIPGREFGVGLLGNDEPEVLPIIEVDFEQELRSIYTIHDKSNHTKKTICPAPLPSSLKNEIERLAIKTYKALNIADYARVDMRMDEKGNIYVLELNSMATLSPTASYFIAARAAGYTYDSLINRIIEVAAARYSKKILKKGISL